MVFVLCVGSLIKKSIQATVCLLCSRIHVGWCIFFLASFRLFSSLCSTSQSSTVWYVSLVRIQAWEVSLFHTLVFIALSCEKTRSTNALLTGVVRHDNAYEASSWYGLELSKFWFSTRIRLDHQVSCHQRDFPLPMGGKESADTDFHTLLLFRLVSGETGGL